ncbi:hypothetical protein [Saccharopolyspora hattusasensis]|uniref:hypothetical protein n=1 Tax=Saccharopolyspora hattusasensis TaxID=1128679 RepID=UPI003D970788
MESTTAGTRLDQSPSVDATSWTIGEASRRVMLGNKAKETAPELELRARGRTGYRQRWQAPGTPAKRSQTAKKLR